MTAPHWLAFAACTDADPEVFFPLGADEERPGGWADHALCAETDPEAFFVEKGGSTRPAKLICSRCPVRPECLTYALQHAIPFGVWGGLSAQERRLIRRRAS